MWNLGYFTSYMALLQWRSTGRRPEVCSGTEITCPTIEQVKRLFSIVQFDLPGARVLDLPRWQRPAGHRGPFSRAAPAFFPDENREAVNIVDEKLVKTETV